MSLTQKEIIISQDSETHKLYTTPVLPSWAPFGVYPALGIGKYTPEYLGVSVTSVVYVACVSQGQDVANAKGDAVFLCSEKSMWRSPVCIVPTKGYPKKFTCSSLALPHPPPASRNPGRGGGQARGWGEGGKGGRGNYRSTFWMGRGGPFRIEEQTRLRHVDTRRVQDAFDI